MELFQIAQIVNEKAAFFDDRELAFVAQALEQHATMASLPRPTPANSAALVGVNAAAKILSLSADYVWKLVASGQLPSVKIGKRRLIRFHELVKFAHGETDTSGGGWLS